VNVTPSGRVLTLKDNVPEDQVFHYLTQGLVRAWHALMMVFVSKNKKADFKQVQEIKKDTRDLLIVLGKDDYKEFEQYLELSKRLHIPMNNKFLEQHKRMMLRKKDFNEPGTEGENLKIIKQTFEMLANSLLPISDQEEEKINFSDAYHEEDDE